MSYLTIISQIIFIVNYFFLKLEGRGGIEPQKLDCNQSPENHLITQPLVEP